MANVEKRYDFVLIYDVQDGNPNGDPDAGNLPRVDAETGMGLVTDVCLKRKIRNYVTIVKGSEKPFDIYVKEKAVLGRAHVQAFKELGIEVGTSSHEKIPEDLKDAFDNLSLCDGLEITFDGDENGELVSYLEVSSDIDKKDVNEWMKEEQISGNIQKFIKSVMKNAKPRKPTADETEKGKEKMCQDYYDIRTFGAVMSLKSAPNCGQVRGPVQLTFSRSLEPIVALDHSITRMAVATEAEAAKQSGDNRTMGRKYTVPYGVYMAHGFVSAHLAAQTGFSQEDLDLLWEALENMFDQDRSAARGMMATRKLIIFEHSTALGNKPAQELFERVKWERTTEGPARSFSDYKITLDGEPIEGIRKVVTV